MEVWVAAAHGSFMCGSDAVFWSVLLTRPTHELSRPSYTSDIRAREALSSLAKTSSRDATSNSQERLLTASVTEQVGETPA